MKRIFYLFLITILFVIPACGGGSGGSSSNTTAATEGLTLSVTSSQPTNSALSAPLLTLGKEGILRPKGITEAGVSGIEIHCEDLAGNEIGEPCTTGEDGTCSITGLTEAQVQAGLIIVSDDGNKEWHSYVERTAAETAAAVEADASIAENCDTETDMAYAVIRSECADDLANCGAQTDRRCMREALQAVVGDDDPSISNVGGYCEGLFQAHASAITQATSGQNPADMMRNALGGDPSAVTNIVGTSIENVPIADAATNCRTMIRKMKEAYCAKETSSSIPTWNTVRTEGGANFDPRAMVGMFKEFEREEMDEYEAEDFRGFATMLPSLTGGFTMFGAHTEARQTLAEQFRLGAFIDPTKAGVALGMMAATFPPCPDGDCRNMTFTNFDPSVAARAAHTGILEFIDTAGDQIGTFHPRDIYNKFNSTLSDATYRQAWATGGSSAAGEFIGGFINDPAHFMPADFVGEIKYSGSDCTTNNDCPPCDVCTNNTCTPLFSTSMGKSCTQDSDCGTSGVLTCTGGFFASAGSTCMCKADVPTGAFVHGETGGPQVFGTGDYRPPTAGVAGAECGAGRPACMVGFSCTDATYGICFPDNGKKGPFAPCTGNAQCESNSCTGGLCALTSAFIASQTGSGTAASDFMTRIPGQPCSAPSQCTTLFCTDGLCIAPPAAFTGAVTLKGPGDACTVPGECTSGFCNNGTCQTLTMTPPAGGGSGPSAPIGILPLHSPCFIGNECMSPLTCDMATHMCM